MLPGPDELIYCPACKAPYIRQTLMSGNTFGGMCFSDGQHFYPMLPDFPMVTKCDECNHYFWLNDLDGQEFNPDGQGVKEPPDIRWMTEEEYVDALKKMIHRNHREEVYLRTRIWWILNNRLEKNRKGSGNGQPFPEKFYEENLLALLRLKEEEEPADRLLIGEIYRELGQFDLAIEILKKVKDDRQLHVARQILEKARQKDRRAFRLE
jgi:hypothetical protein